MLCRTAALSLVLIAPALAQADDYQEMDRARAAIVAALDTGDVAAFASFVGPDVDVTDVWFDKAACRKRFSTVHLKAKDARAFAACFTGLGVQAKGLNIHYGPGVLLGPRLKVIDGKPVLVSLGGSPARNRALPEVWKQTFEAHRKAGDPAITLDPAAQAELTGIGETGAVFYVCVDARGRVNRTEVALVSAKGPTSTQLRAATKSWAFEPFTVRGKPAPACATLLVKLAPPT